MSLRCLACVARLVVDASFIGLDAWSARSLFGGLVEKRALSDRARVEVDLRKARLVWIEALRLEAGRLLGHVESSFTRGEHRFCRHLREWEPGLLALEVHVRFEVVLLGRVSQELPTEIFGVHAEPGLDHREAVFVFGSRWAGGRLGGACIEFGWYLADFRLCRGLELFQMGWISPTP